MQASGKQYTIAEIVSNFSKDNPELTKSYVKITTGKYQQLNINSCIELSKGWLFFNKKQSLLFICKKQAKIIVGKVAINEEKVKLKSKDYHFNQFAQIHLQITSSYHEAKALKHIEFRVEEKKNYQNNQVQARYYLLDIFFKSQQVWTFQFDELNTAQLWLKLLNQMIENQKKQKEQIQNKLKQMITQYPILLRQIEKLKQNMHYQDKQFNKQLEAERTINRELNMQIEKLKEQLKEKSRIHEQEKQTLQQCYQKQKRQLIQSHRQMIQSRQRNQKELQDRFENQQKELYHQKNQLKEKLNRQKQILQTQLKKHEESLQIAHQANTINQKDIVTKNDQITSLTQLLNRSRNSQTQLQKQLELLKEQHCLSIRSNQKQKKQLQLSIKQLQEQAYLHIFQGNVLHQYPYEKEFLRQQVQKYTKRKILYTKLLYRFDNINKINFHKYIDQHPNICIVIKLENGMSIAGFSQDGISQQKQPSKGGFLSSLTNMVSFELIEGCRSVSYDDYFLIFGNCQLRIRCFQLLLFSNFALSNGYYASHGQKYNILLGGDASRTERIYDYEVFQIIFK